MDGYVVHGGMGMARGSYARIEDGRGILVYVWDGELWITQEGDPRDHFVRARRVVPPRSRRRHVHAGDVAHARHPHGADPGGLRAAHHADAGRHARGARPVPALQHARLAAQLGRRLSFR